MSRRIIIPAAVLAIAATALTGCAPSSGGGGAAATDQLDVAITLQTLVFDPYLSDRGPSAPVLQPAYETLIKKQTDGSYEPWLADSYEYLSPTSFQLHIRDDVTFADGTPLTAEVVVANLNRIFTVSGSQVSYARNIAKVEATDESTVLLTLSTPDPSMEDLLSHNIGMMVNPTALEDPSLATTPAGTGPYVMDEGDTVAGNKWTFVRNEDYWGDEKEYPYDRIQFDVLSDASSILNAMRAGTVDIAVGDTTTVDAAEAANLTITTAPNATWGLVLTDRGGEKLAPMGDVRVRQALNFAIDREAITTALVGEFGAPATQWFGPWTTAYDEELEDAYTYDPEKAKALLAEAGYPSGFDLGITIAPIHPAMAQALQGYLSEIGVNLTFDNTGDFFADVPAQKHPAFAWTQAMSDPYIALQEISSPTGFANPFHTEDPDLLGLIGEAAGKAEADDRAATYKQISKHLAQEAWFLPVYFGETVVYSSPDVTVELWPGEYAPWLYGWKPAR